MFDGLRKLLGTVGQGTANAAHNAQELPNNLAVMLTGHALTGGSPPQQSPLPAVDNFRMEAKAVPFGANPNTPYNRATANNNQNMQNHVQDLAVNPASRWQMGPLQVATPQTDGVGSPINPFDTDTQVSPFQLGSRNNYQTSGQLNGVNDHSLQELLKRRY